jgi:hypothetical protein
MSENTLTRLERQSLELVLSPENCKDEKLRQQIDAVAVRGREQTDVGMFVEFEVPADMASDDRARYVFSNLSGEMPGLENGFGGVLYVEDGLLLTLEFFTYDEQWPERPEDYRLFLEGN